MSETQSVAPAEVMTSPERFTGVPTEVPFKEVTVGIPDTDKGEMWKPGIMDFNGGLVAAHDSEFPLIHIAVQEDAGLFTGYEHGSANVPLTGGDQRGWHGGELSRPLAEMGINHTARNLGVLGRTIPTPDGKYDMFTANPFDSGDFLDMTGVAEVAPTGQELVTRDLVSEIASGSDAASKGLEAVGKFNNNNGVMSWVTPEGRAQIAPHTLEREARLKELGYQAGEINVPHSNGEAFQEKQSGDPGQAYGEVLLAELVRSGKTISKAERDSAPFRSVIIPTKFSKALDYL